MVVTVVVMGISIPTGTTLQLSDDRGTVRRLESQNWIDNGIDSVHKSCNMLTINLLDFTLL